MTKASHFIYCFTSICLIACSSGDDRSAKERIEEGEGTDSLQALQEEPNRKENNQVADTISFENAFNQFFMALQTTDTTMLGHFIHPELGVWILEQPGAVPKMTRVMAIRNFKRSYQDRSFFTIAQEVKACDLQEEPFPTFDCADMEGSRSWYSKDGCFVWDPGKFRTSGYWNYASLSETQIDQVKATLPLIQRSVLHTGSSFEFQFGYVNQQWRLLFAKLIYPCSA